MKKTILATVLSALGVVAGACNEVGDCPSPSSIVPGAHCSGDNLECPFTLQTPSMACDGTMEDGGVSTSCVCQDEVWVCPEPTSCGDDGGTDGAGEDGGATTEAGGDAPASDGPAAEAAAAAAEAASEAAAEAAAEGSTDGGGD